MTRGGVGAITAIGPVLRALGASLLTVALAASQAAAATTGTVALAFLGLEGEVPARWERQTPASSMRVAQMRVPGPPPAEFVVYHFGRHGGGPASANIARWRSQFSGPDGAPVAPTLGEVDSLGGSALLVELAGSYARGVGMGPVGEPRPEQMLLAAIVERPSGKIIVQLHGAATTVRANRGAFVEMLRGLRPATAR